MALAREVAQLKDDVAHLESAVSSMTKAVEALSDVRKSPQALDNSAAFLSAFGHTVVGWLWVSQALVSHRIGTIEPGNRAACRYFLRVELPKAHVGFEQAARAEASIADVDSSVF